MAKTLKVLKLAIKDEVDKLRVSREFLLEKWKFPYEQDFLWEGDHQSPEAFRVCKLPIFHFPPYVFSTPLLPHLFKTPNRP